jgi:hypothetical protein
MEARFQGNHCLVRNPTYLPTPNTFLGIDYQTIHLLGPLLALTLLALSISTSFTAMPLPFNPSPTLLVVSSKYLANRTEKGFFGSNQQPPTNQSCIAGDPLASTPGLFQLISLMVLTTPLPLALHPMSITPVSRQSDLHTM